MKQIPPLIKAYLRIGGFVGKDAYIDQSFNTIDVCMVLDVKRADLKRLSVYKKENYL
jgi:putative hemolysin